MTHFHCDTPFDSVRCVDEEEKSSIAANALCRSRFYTPLLKIRKHTKLRAWSRLVFLFSGIETHKRLTGRFLTFCNEKAQNKISSWSGFFLSCFSSQPLPHFLCFFQISSTIFLFAAFHAAEHARKLWEDPYPSSSSSSSATSSNCRSSPTSVSITTASSSPLVYVFIVDSLLIKLGSAGPRL